MSALGAPELDPKQVAAALSEFDISLSPAQIRLVVEYTALLLKWNRSINLTTVTDPVEIVRRHFGECMFATKLLSVENCRLADVGSGAGFPGLALKIVNSSAKIILIESNKKKCAFLSEVVRTLDFSDTEIRAERFEGLRAETLRTDFILARAVGNLKPLLRWSKNALAAGGQLVLWLGSEDATRLARESEWIWQPALHIPTSQRRYILIGKPRGQGKT